MVVVSFNGAKKEKRGFGIWLLEPVNVKEVSFTVLCRLRLLIGLCEEHL